MKVIDILFILRLMLYIQSTSTLIISHEHTKDKLTDIPARSDNIRMLDGKYIGNYSEYANIAQIYYPHYPQTDNYHLNLWCRGVLIAPKWVVTVAHCFDSPILQNSDRLQFSNFFLSVKHRLNNTRGQVVVGRNGTQGSGHYVQFEKIHINNRYDRQSDNINYVDVALVELNEAVPKHIAAPPYRISSDLEADSSRMYPLTQDCWVVSAGHTSPDEVLGWDVTPLHRMKVFVGNGNYCSVLDQKLYQGKTQSLSGEWASEYFEPNKFVYNEEYVCATTNESVDPGARLCIKGPILSQSSSGDDGAALVCGNGYLLGLLSRLHESGKCQGENAYGQYIYLGNHHVYAWMSGIIYGTIQSDDTWRRESASGLVEANKAVTWVLTMISVAVTLNTYYWDQ